MIKVVAQFFLKDGDVEKALELAEKLVAETRKESGCHQYDLFQNAERVTHITFIEEWENQAALDAHFQAPHFVELVPELQALTDREAVITSYNKIM